MLIGIKYCGGCNSRYNRVEFLECIKKKLPHLHFTSVSITKRVDFMIVICGCTASCAQIEDVYSVYGHIIIDSNTTHQQAIVAIKEAEQKYSSDIDKKKEFTVGSSIAFKKEIKEVDVTLFKNTIHLFNLVYTDDSCSQKAHIPSKAVPGRLLADFVSAYIETKFAGDGMWLLEDKTKFIKPSVTGNIIAVEIKLSECEEQDAVYMLTFAAVCTNEKKELLLEYNAKFSLPKTMFKKVE